MDSISLDRNLLLVKLRQLITATGVRVKPGDSPFQDKTCRWYTEEGYKYDVVKKAKAALAVHTWSLEKPEYIIECIKEAIWIPNDYGTRPEQNFISNAEIMPLLSILAESTSQFADVFYKMYWDLTSDEESFRSLMLLLARYQKKLDIMAIIAYFFFIKDKSKYVPLRKEAYQKRLPVLKLQKKYVEVCSWENYCIICSVMEQIAEFLQLYFPDSELIDGQSFFWMFHYFDGKKAIAEAEFPPVEVFTKGKLHCSAYKPVVKENGLHFDPIERAIHNNETGKFGEEFVLKYEKSQGRKVEWVSQLKGDGLGYDILSLDKEGNERYIEVKATTGKESTPFYITAIELEASKKYGESYYLYRVYEENSEQKIAYYQGKEIEQLCNTPALYIVAAE